LANAESEKVKVLNRVRRLRRARGLTQDALAALLGVSRQTVNAIENGRYDPGLKLAFDIARVFAARVEDVFRPLADAREWTEIMISIPDRLELGDVVLRPHRASDLAQFQRFLGDPDATRFMAFTLDQKTPEGAAAMMDAVIGSYATDTPICSLTIADPGDDSYLGATGAAEARDGAMEVFVTVMPEAQRSGVGATAMGGLVDHLFATSGPSELRADVVDENAASVRLFEKLGFRRQGPVERAAEDGALGHRDMQGIRYVLTARQHRARLGGKRS
jgi:DNA-binding XRE family transcriptional regulator/L-amino acid N-acyltransferase YncA